MTQTISAVAAVLAAIFSFRNIFISNRLARFSELQKWRRDAVLKTIIDFLRTTQEIARSSVFDLNEDDEMQSWLLKEEARVQLFELSLVASQECVKVGRILLNNLDDAEEDGPVRKQFIAACRADLGIE